MARFAVYVRGLILLALLVLIPGCAGASKPMVVITSPPSGSQFREGEDVALQSTSTDATGVTRVELIVDGSVTRVDPSPTAQGTPNFALTQAWKATPGTHTLLVRAYNVKGEVSDPVAISITVVAGAVAKPTAPPTAVAQPTALPQPSPVPAGACVDDASFAVDVTIPDGTVIPAGQTFNKVWRLTNNGTCAWGAGYQFVFVGGESMSRTNIIAVPATSPGGTADLLVAMTAPAAPGSHTGLWRLRNASGAAFGVQVSAKITVPTPAQPTAPPAAPTATPAPAGCAGAPRIDSFSASQTTLSAPGNVTLNWGLVINADAVEIDNDLGGVATPGSRTVAINQTTTFTMTARCGANVKTAQVTITIVPPTATPTKTP